MAIELAEVYLSLIPSLKGASKSLGREADSVGKSAGKRMSGGMSSGIAGAAKSLFAPVVAAATAVSAGSALKYGVEIAAQNEQAAISFTTMLGSAEKANDFIGKMKEFAAKTPFELPGLQKSASTLIAAGISADKVIPIMTTLGNVTSGMGTGAEGISRATVALQQMNAAGKITGEDLNQLRDAGIPVYDLLAAATGKSKAAITELAASGKLGKTELDAMMKALESGKGLERFAGLMDKQSASLTGMWSTLKDTFGQGLATAIEPALPAIKGLLGTVTAGLEPAMVKLAGGFKSAIDWGAKMAPTFQSVGAAIGAAFSILTKGDFNKKIGEALGGVSEDSPIVDILFTIRETAQQLAPMVGGMISNWLGLFKQLAPAIGPFLQTLFDIAKQLFPVFQTLQKTVFTAIGDIVSELLPAISGLIQAVLPTLGQIGKAVGGVLNAVIPIVSQIISTLLQALKENMPTIRTAFNTIGQIIRDVGTLITAIWQKIGPIVLPLIKTIFGTVVKIIGGAFEIIGGLVKVVTGILTGDWKKAGEGLKQIIGGAWKIITGIFEGARKILTTIFGGAVKWLLDKANGFRQGVNDTFNKIVNFVKTTFNNGINFIKSIFSTVFNFVVAFVQYHILKIRITFERIVSWIRTTFSAGIERIKKIFNDVLTGARIVVTAAIDKVRGTFRGITDWLKTTFKTAFEKVKGFITGPIDTAKKVIGDILGKDNKSGLRGVFSKAVEKIGGIWEGLQNAAKKPVKFVIETVINGLIGSFNDVSGFFGGPKIDKLKLPPGFHDGGYTGPGSEMQPAGIVHADEFVVSKRARKSFESAFPGYLSYINANGTLPGYARGGIVDGPTGNSSALTTWKGKTFTRLFAQNLRLAEELSGTSFNIFQGGFRPTTSYSGTSHAKDAIDLGPITNAVIVALRRVGIAAWDRTGKGNWAPHIHAVPTPGAGFAGGSAVWQAQDYLNGGDGLGGRDNGPKVNSDFAGTLPGGLDIGKLLSGPLNVAKDFFGGALDKLTEITDSPFGKLVGAVPGKIVDLAAQKVADLVNPFGYANGTVAGRAGLNKVGERGAELVLGPSVRNFRGGERVIPLGGGGLGGDDIDFIDCHFGVTEAEVITAIDRRKRHALLRQRISV